MWPWVGEIAVVVALVMVAFCRSITTWTTDPVTVVPDTGWVIVTTAGEDGRPLAAADASGDAGADAGAGEPPDPLQATKTRASTTATTARIDGRSALGAPHGSPHGWTSMSMCAWSCAPSGAGPATSTPSVPAETVVSATKWPGSSCRGLSIAPTPSAVADGHRDGLDRQLRAGRVEERRVELVRSRRAGGRGRPGSIGRPPGGRCRSSGRPATRSRPRSRRPAGSTRRAAPRPTRTGSSRRPTTCQIPSSERLPAEAANVPVPADGRARVDEPTVVDPEAIVNRRLTAVARRRRAGVVVGDDRREVVEAGRRRAPRPAGP